MTDVLHMGEGGREGHTEGGILGAKDSESVSGKQNSPEFREEGD